MKTPFRKKRGCADGCSYYQKEFVIHLQPHIEIKDLQERLSSASPQEGEFLEVRRDLIRKAYQHRCIGGLIDEEPLKSCSKFKKLPSTVSDDAAMESFLSSRARLWQVVSAVFALLALVSGIAGHRIALKDAGTETSSLIVQITDLKSELSGLEARNSGLRKSNLKLEQEIRGLRADSDAAITNP